MKKCLSLVLIGLSLACATGMSAGSHIKSKVPNTAPAPPQVKMNLPPSQTYQGQISGLQDRVSKLEAEVTGLNQTVKKMCAILQQRDSVPGAPGGVFNGSGAIGGIGSSPFAFCGSAANTGSTASSSGSCTYGCVAKGGKKHHS